MLGCVVGLVVLSVSKDCIVCISAKWSEKMSLVSLLLDLAFLQNNRNLSPSDTASHYRRLDPSTPLTACLVAEHRCTLNFSN